MMEDEQEKPKPLAADEIKEGMVVLIADAIYDRLNKTCNLFGQAYPKFRAKWSVDIELDDFGAIITDHSEGAIETTDQMHDDMPVMGSIPVERVNTEGALHIEGKVEEMPPNKFRVETEQPVTVNAVEDGKPVERQVKYKSKRQKSTAAKRAAENMAKKQGKAKG